MNDREMILELGKDLTEAVTLANHLALQLFKIERSETTSQAVRDAIKPIVADSITRAALLRMRAEIATDYGSRGKIVYMGATTRSGDAA